MKSLFFLGLFVLSSGCWGTATGTIRREQDEFTLEARLTLRGMSVYLSSQDTQSLVSSARLFLDLTSRPRATQATLTFRPWDTDDLASWRYLRCHSVHFLVNGRPVPFLDSAEHDGEVSIRSGVQEAVSLSISREVLTQMGNAQTVKGRVCTDVFEMNPEQIRQIGVFAHSMQFR